MRKISWFLLSIALYAIGQGHAYSRTVPSSGQEVFWQNGSAIPVSRDDQLRLTLNPEQFGAAGNGSGENGDDCQAINQAIRYAALGSGENTPKVLHLNGRHYRCSKANYQVLLPRDFGDYAADASGAGAQFSLNVVNGSIHSCYVSGGNGYNPYGWVIGQIKDSSYSGSGGAVHAMTDAKGVPIPSSCVVDSAGMNYPPTGVDIYSYAQGADGAAVRATLTQGRFVAVSSVANNSSMPQGNGYRSPALLLPADLTCTSNPRFAAKVGTSGLSASGLVGVIIANPGTNCTYHGASSAEVPVWVGGSSASGTAQAKNIEPSPAYTIGCAVQLRQGVSIEGDGGTIQTDWQTGVYGTKQIVAFCDAYGNQSTNLNIRNLTIAAPAGLWLSGRTKNVVLENITELYASTNPQRLKTYIPGPGGGLFFYAAQTGEGTVIRNVSNYAPAGIEVGGQYTARGDSGLGSMGGDDVSRNKGAGTYVRGGVADGLIVDNFRQYAFHGNTNYNAALDRFFEQYVWHSDYTGLRDQPSCPQTMAPADRSVQTLQIDSVKASPCYRGISDRPLTLLSRSPYLSRHVNLSNIWEEQAYRPMIVAGVTESRFVMVNLAAIGTAYKDPYADADHPTSALIELTAESASSSSNTFEGVFHPDEEGKRFDKVQPGFAGVPQARGSSMMVSGLPVPVAVQHVFTKPDTAVFTHHMSTSNPLTSCYASSPGTALVVSLIEGDTQNVRVTASAAGTVTCVFQFAPPAVRQ
jgi:hypothetical protein